MAEGIKQFRGKLIGQRGRKREEVSGQFKGQDRRQGRKQTAGHKAGRRQEGGRRERRGKVRRQDEEQDRG
jgi:hypothetical protein